MNNLNVSTLNQKILFRSVGYIFTKVKRSAKLSVMRASVKLPTHQAFVVRASGYVNSGVARDFNRGRIVINCKNHQKSLAQFSHSAACVVFIERLSQNGYKIKIRVNLQKFSSRLMINTKDCMQL